jgi:mRNA interferase RelE/StbE
MLRSKRLAWQIEIDEAAKTELGNFWKYRLGDIRIVASIEDDRLVILVLRVGNRKEIYRC